MKIKSKDYKNTSEYYVNKEDYSLKTNQCNKNIYGYMDSFIKSSNS